MIRKVALASIVALSATGFLAACGSSSDNSASSTTEGAAASTTTGGSSDSGSSGGATATTASDFAKSNGCSDPSSDGTLTDVGATSDADCTLSNGDGVVIGVFASQSDMKSAESKIVSEAGSFAAVVGPNWLATRSDTDDAPTKSDVQEIQKAFSGTVVMLSK